MIEQMGMDTFYSSPVSKDLEDIEPPVCFNFIFSAFMTVKNYCYKAMTLRDIRAYEELYNIKLTDYEIEIIMKCNGWAEDQIKILEKEQE